MGDTQSFFIFEPEPELLDQVVASVEEAGHKAVAASSIEEATACLEDESLTLLLIAHCEVGIELGQYVREFASCKAPVIAMVSSDVEDREEAVAEMGADGYLVPPFSADVLRGAHMMAEKLRKLGLELVEVKSQLKQQPAQLRRLASAINSQTGFYQFDFIKELLVTEVRRAKRYGYPLAIMMVGLDPIPALHELKRPRLQRDITGGLAVAISKSIRDIDIPIHYADDRIMVFLPHTDLSGSEEVGRRIKRRIKRITYRGEGITAQLTASVGVAGISSGDSLTFSRLVRDASAALKAAQLKGGDRVMKRVQRTGPEI